MKSEVKIAKAAAIILFIALIRTLAEPFRLQYYSERVLNFEEIKPFLLAGLLVGAGLLAITILHYFGKHKMIIALSLVIIALMLVIKFIYPE